MRRRYYAIKVIQVFFVFLFVMANFFLFQNCSQPLQSMGLEESIQSSYFLSKGLIAPRIGKYYSYGDMLVDSSELDKFNENLLNSPVTINSVGIRPTGNEMWPGLEIPIRVVRDNPDDFTLAELEGFRKSVFAACELWAKEVNISCVSYTQGTHVLEAVLTKDIQRYCGSRASACAAYPTASGIRGLWAYDVSGELSGIMVHEIGHSLGLIHEHQHNDIDKYYAYSSTDPSTDPFLYQTLPYKYLNFGIAQFIFTDYDPQSVMHYSSIPGAYPKPGYYHLQRLSSSGAFWSQNGKIVLSVKDILGAQSLYGARPNSRQTCLEPKTQKPYFFENTMQGYFDKKVASKGGEKCNLENRLCLNGQLSGTFSESSCQEICIIRNGVILQRGETRTVYIKQSNPFEPGYNEWLQAQAICSGPEEVQLKDQTGNSLPTPILEEIYEVIPTDSYVWSITQSGNCSAAPSYSYGTWSTCDANSKQSRSFQCVNTSGVKSQIVVCKDSSGRTVEDSDCSKQPKPASSVSCTANCSGSLVTSQACVYSPTLTYAWSISDFGSCSASPIYSYGDWSLCTSQSIQTRSSQCVNNSGLKTRTVVCKDSLGSPVEDSKCVVQNKPETRMSCTGNCSGSPIISQKCIYKPPVSEDLQHRVCVPKNSSQYQSLYPTLTSQEYTLTNPLEIKDSKFTVHYTKNSSFDPDIVVIHKSGRYSIVTLHGSSGVSTTPPSIVLEGNSEDYQIKRESTDNMILLVHKSCGEIVRYIPQGSGSKSLFINFKNCSATLTQNWSQQGTLWGFNRGDRVPLNSIQEITGCAPHSELSHAPRIHMKYFSW